MSGLVQDLRYAIRGLTKAPGFTAVAVLTLALGIGVNSAIFSFADATLLRPLPFDEPDQLVMVTETRPNQTGRGHVAFLNFVDWRAQSRTFESMAAVTSSGVTVQARDGTPEQIPSQSVTVDFFHVFRVQAMIGRTFLAADVGPKPNVVVVSERFWRSRLGADPAIVGRALTLNGQPFSVIGVIPLSFQIFQPSELWTLFSAPPGAPFLRRARFFDVVGQLERGVNPAVITDWNVVTPRYFDVVRMPILRGRSFTSLDGAGAPNVVVINETLARRAWPGEDPVGHTLVYGEDRKTAQIVGVVRDAKYRSLGENPRPFLYAPQAQNYQSELWLLIRRRPPTVLPAVRALVRDADPNLPIVQETTLADATAFSLFPQRVAAGLAGAVGLNGILLASLGLYGITAYNVTRRTREIGVRLALGALPIQVLRLVLRQSMLLVSSGAALGLLLAGFATQLLGTLLYGVEPLDAMSFVVGALLFGSVAVMAAWFAARRAARVDPLVALRYE